MPTTSNKAAENEGHLRVGGAAIATALLVAGCLGSDTSAQDEGPRARPCPASAEGPPCGTGARIGQDYDYVLYTHCGIQTAVFNGRRWRAVRPPTLRPEKYPNETKGVMRFAVLRPGPVPDGLACCGVHRHASQRRATVVLLSVQP